MQCRPPDKLRLLCSVEPIACKRVPDGRRMNAYLMCPPRAKSEFDRNKPAFVFISLSIVFFFYNDVFSLFVFLRRKSAAAVKSVIFQKAKIRDRLRTARVNDAPHGRAVLPLYGHVNSSRVRPEPTVTDADVKTHIAVRMQASR